MINEELGGCTGVNDAIVRIFFRSHPLVVTGCAVSLGLAMREESKQKQLLYCANIAICLLSLLISFTRSVYLAVFVAVVVAVIAIGCFTSKVERKKMVALCAKSVGLFMAFLLVCDIFFGGAFLSYGLYRTTGVDVMNKVEVSLGMKDGALGGGFGLVLPDEGQDADSDSESEEKPTTNEDGEFDPAIDINAWSDNLRQQTVAELYARIKEHPIVGSGMGTTLDVRADSGGTNEYFYLDMTLTTGIIGTLLYVAPMILIVLLFLTGYKKIDRESFFICTTWLAGLLGIAAFATLNPYLNGSNGIALYCCTIGTFTALHPKRQITE